MHLYSEIPEGIDLINLASSNGKSSHLHKFSLVEIHLAQIH